MLNKFLKIFKHILYIAKAKKVWKRPLLSDILIFDACGEDFLRQCIEKKSVSILSVRGEHINLWPLLLSIFFFRPNTQGYIDFYIRLVRPKLIITYIDNTPAFYEIKSRNPTIPTLFIQNGWRSYYGDVFEKLARDSNSNIRVVDYMLCFGDVIGNHYKKYISGNVISVGSLRNNIYSNKWTKKRGLIAFISQWTRDGLVVGDIKYSQAQASGLIDEKVLKFLWGFCEARKISLSIIPRTRPNSPDRQLENAYFYNILGEGFQYIEFNEAGTSYRAIDEAEVVVGIDSTLAYESLSRGNKTAIFSIRGTSLGIGGLGFGWPGIFPDDGFFWTNHFSVNGFEKIMSNLLSCSDEVWRSELEKINFSKLMIYNPGNQVIKELINQLVDY